MHRMPKSAEMKELSPELLSEEEKLHLQARGSFMRRNLRLVVACTFLGTCCALLVVPMGGAPASVTVGNGGGHVYKDKAVDIDGVEFLMGDRFAGKFLFITNTASF